MSKITGKVTYKEVLKGDTGYTFEPHVTVDGILYWTNNGNLENPLPVNLHGKQCFMFIPHVDSEGNLSWTNTGELENPPTVNIKGDKGYFYTPHISQDGVLTWSNNGGLENPQPFNISDLILNEVKESRVDTTGKTFSKLKERLDSDFKKLSESIKNNDTKDEVVQSRTATTGENFMTLDDRIDHEVMRLREKIEVTMLEQEDKESHDISNTIDGVCSDMIIKGKTIKLDNGEIKSFGQQENKISILSRNKNMFDCKKLIDYGKDYNFNILDAENNIFTIKNHQNTNIDLLSIMEINKNILPISISFKTEIVEGGIGYLRAFYKDGTDKYIGNVSGGYTTYKISKDIDKLVFSYGSTGTTKFLNVQIEYGESSSSYQPPHSDKKDILLQNLGFDEGLRGFDLTICDELNDIKNVAIKRVEKHSFTGEEILRKSNTYGDVIRFDYKLSNLKFASDIICNNFDKGIIGSPNLECINVHSNDNLVQIQIKANKLETQDVEGFKKWLKENPTTIYYELAEPVETPLNENINVKNI